jgi:hypothetical protein
MLQPFHKEEVVDPDECNSQDAPPSLCDTFRPEPFSTLCAVPFSAPHDPRGRMPLNYASPAQLSTTSPLPLPDRGEGTNYQPYTRVYQHAPAAYAERHTTLLNERVMHLHSKMELRAALQFELNPAVVDLWEQYPLPTSDTAALAEMYHLRNPIDSRTHAIKPVVTTIVAVLRTPEGNRQYRPCFVCTEHLCSYEKAKNLIALQEYWWQPRGEKLNVLTDSTLTAATEWNARVLLRGRSALYRKLLSSQQCEDQQSILLRLASTTPTILIRDALAAAEAATHALAGSGFAALDALFTRHLISLDLHRAYCPFLPLGHVVASTTNKEGC